MHLLFILNSLMIVTVSIYDFQVTSIDGAVIDFADFKGKKILIVNTASECGYTNQYEGLQKLHETMQENLVVIGFPSNDFGKQEPGTDTEIAAFCEAEYGISFLMASKINVKDPSNMHPIYTWLTSKELNGYADSQVKWNFNKYLIDEKGNLIGVYGSKVKPLSEELLEAIKR